MEIKTFYPHDFTADDILNFNTRMFNCIENTTNLVEAVAVMNAFYSHHENIRVMIKQQSNGLPRIMVKRMPQH